MRRWIWVLITFSTLAFIGIYLANPFGTASWDPRARILGYATFRIPSTAMAPTLKPGDFILVQTSAYASTHPKIGEIITFHYPRNPAIDYVKRVAAGPGDKISIRKGVVYVNSNPIPEPYLDTDRLYKPFSIAMDETTIPSGQLFVLGDNRDESSDSRIWGTVPTQSVIGKVTYIWWSSNRDRIGKVH